MNVNSNHWICIFVNDKKNKVDIYDSLYSSIKLKVVDDLIDLLHTAESSVMFNSTMMQKQVGFTDCSVFSIAEATSLCFKQDATTVRLKVESMRSHLVKRLEEGKMEPFSQGKSEKGSKGKIKKTIMYDIHVHCTCRRRHKRNQTMKQCHDCKQWFHQKCLKHSKNCTSCFRYVEMLILSINTVLLINLVREIYHHIYRGHFLYMYLAWGYTKSFPYI